MFGNLFGKKKKTTEATKMSLTDAQAAEVSFLNGLDIKKDSDADKMKQLLTEINETLIAKGTLPEHNE